MGRHYHGGHGGGRSRGHHGGGYHNPYMTGSAFGDSLLNNVLTGTIMLGITRLFDGFDRCVDRSIANMQQPQQVVYTAPPPQMMQPMQQMAPPMAYQMDIYGNIYDANGNIVGNANRQATLTTM